MKGPFQSLASFTAADPTSVPYSADLNLNQHDAYKGVDMINWSPRIGFSWSPTASQKTVVSGGFGLFYDNAPESLVDDLLANPPVSVAIRVRPSAGVLAFDPGSTGGAALFAASAAAFNVNQSYSQISSAMAAVGGVFTPPSPTDIIGTMHSPEWQEWNLQIQQEFGTSYALIVNYAGNHGVKIPYTNQWANAFDQYGLFPGVSALPTSAPVPNYGTVTTVQNGAVSNYNGLSISLRKRMNHGFSFDVNYTWSHNLDEVSNGGINTYGDSILSQNNPYSLYAGNYGPSDYDIRHNFNGDLIYNPSWKFGNKFLNAALGGWEYGLKFFMRSGLPFSVTDSNLAAGNYGGSFLAQPLAGMQGQSGNCGEGAANTPCLNTAAFLDTSSFNGYNYFPFGGRNAFRGPWYYDVDMSLYKTFSITERVKLGVGAQAFNALNHPNFALPDSTLGDANFGKVTAMYGTPTSPYGNFLGFDSSVRIVQLSGKLTF